jgi:peptide/nickel transport system substrate-binding protein
VFLNPAENKALGELPVRKALSLAVDRDHLTNSILGGYAESRTDPLPTGVSEAEDPLQSGDRIAQAKKILTDAGWVYSDANGTWSNAKKKLTLNPITIKTSNVPELKTLAGEIQKNWEAIGVKTSLEFHDQNSLSADVIRPRKYDALFFGLVVGRENDLFAFWDSSERNDPGLNIALYANKTVDALLEKARTQSDETERADTLEKASSIIASEYGAIFTHTPYFLYAVPTDLKGVILPEITTPSDRFATVSTWYRRTQYVWPAFAKK